MTQYVASVSAALALLCLSHGSAFAENAKPDAPSWRETNAYTLGMQAYVYSFPYLYMSQLRWRWTTQPLNPEKSPYMPLNSFWHRRGVTDAKWREGGAPNNDTSYSFAWLDVSKDPVILCHPDMGTRYFTFQIADYSSDNFAYVGKRATGSKAGCFAIAMNNWKGRLPKNVTLLARAPTPNVVVAGRILVDGPADVPNVTALQDKLTLTPLSYFGKNVTPPERRDVWKPYDGASDQLADWKTINRALSENPPPAKDTALIALFSQIGVGPGQDVDAQDADTKRGLVRALTDGRQLLKGTIAAGAGSPVQNGWRILPKEIGRAGLAGNFLLRAAMQSLIGIMANDPVENVYPLATSDRDGRPLSGAHRYTIHFEAGQLPPVNAFWSLSLYGADYNFVENPINRYAIGDRTRDLKFGADGSLTVLVQKNAPDGTGAANWLPAPEGPFLLVMRLYLPKPQVTGGTWSPPAVTPVQ